MKTLNRNRCSRLRDKLIRPIESLISSDSNWLQSHLSHCSRCRKRFVDLSRVDFSLNILKSQPHSIDLLANANNKALGFLKHSLRYAPQAQTLRELKPKVKTIHRVTAIFTPLINAAACIGVVTIMRFGFFDSVKNFTDTGQQIVDNYYSQYIDEES